MSWRADTPEAVQTDLDLPADHALSAAQGLLEKHGEFYPFAVSLTDDGLPAITGADPGQGEHPSSQAVLDLLYDGATAWGESRRAAAFVAPITTPDGGDAVRAEIEHRDGGPALVLMLPYRRKKFRQSIEFGELSAGRGERRVWM